jgi:hypothetical protein
LGGTSSGYGYGIAVDNSSNIYVTGQTLGSLGGTNSGLNDIFLVKYNSGGVNLWNRQLGTSSNEYGKGVTVDSSGNIYVTGHAWTGLDGNTSSGQDDIFLVKYNSSGTKQWTQQLGTSEYDWGHDVTVDSSDNIYVTGHTMEGLDGNTHLGCSDVVLIKYYDNGTKQWTKQSGSSACESGENMSIDSSNNIYLTGGTSGGIDGNTNSGGEDIFLMKFNSDGVLQ